ncbi:MAG: chromosome segregation protein SMC [Candidatus Competibacteraceae bacterium]|jgi:chromosome segregation protein|nr:chromosome segregation protein SMC [Candidatus Competibacteraceae bacterium]
MRLTKVKLAGFKSFVDPTTFHLPSSLVGIVGPNGCGKSNLIDAVRWVMGESSARNLRGESMADVIFNGSASRKPVGQATIELVFDNNEGRLGGPWANYNEIAIKRLVTRDGQSQYFLNGTRCRRRDITDIFLGTGLGPRSYAIIEQGMISRIIEARPEELRVFFEEAAGISKYKERRKETATRIAHTQENLNRLNDLRDELARQLNNLQRQARAAEQYKNHQTEERRLKGELLALRWRSLNQEVSDRQRLLREQETQLEAVLAEQRNVEARLTASREQQVEFNTAFNQAQAHYYELGTEISRLEQQFTHQRELRQRQQAETEQVEQALTQVMQQTQQDEARLTELRQALAAAKPELAIAQAAAAEAQTQLQEAESALQEWQLQWDDFNRRANEPQRLAEVERTRIEHLERQLLNLERRGEKVRVERESIAEAGLTEELEVAQQEQQSAETSLQLQQSALDQMEERIAELRTAQHQLSERLHASQARIQTHQGQLASLKTLQESALGDHQGVVQDWLNNQNLAQAPRLAECLEVEPGWEGIAETLLGDYLDAICVENLTPVATHLTQLKQGQLRLFATAANQYDTPSSSETTPLLGKIQAPGTLTDLLAGVQVATDLDEAIARHRSLGPGESLVTPDGIRVGRNWLQVKRGTDAEAGILAREREIHLLEAALSETVAELEQHSEQMTRVQTELHDLEQQRSARQENVNQGHREQTHWQNQINTLNTRMTQYQARRQALDEEYQELSYQLEQDQHDLYEARLRLEEALQAMEELHEERELLQEQRETLRSTVTEYRQHAHEAQQAMQRQALAEESLRTQQTSANQALERLHLQREQLESRHTTLQAERITEDTPAEREKLAALLDARVAAETQLAAKRQALEQQDNELRELERARSERESRTQELRQQLESQRLTVGEAKVRQQTFADQIRELDMELESLVEQLPTDVVEAHWQDQLDQVAKRIQRLGPINLAAIEEFAQLSERKQYLDAQHEDLIEALNTLDNAMRKIDRETRERFQETFERVNVAVQQLFPRLFGGGQAHLELNDAELLNAGVVIMARPPGKRISHIQLLSGGEKALTAVALVFAIFQLNPAPFCMLDEVDAPLDEANVGRFGELVREMSERIQFIFITHNKATMEIAQQLSGVTMLEPGVSRLVDVDVGEAVRLAAVS